MRGSLQYHGAGNGRWAGRGAQLQNLPRSSTENHDEILAMVAGLSTGDADPVGMLYQRPPPVVQDCIRGLLCAVRKGVVQGRSVAVRVDLGGRRSINRKKNKNT